MDERASRILDAARSRFERFGVKKTTMDEICRDVGISKKTLYEYFRTKQDLFISTFIREALKSRDLAIKYLSDIDDPLDQIRGVFRFAVNYQWRESFMITVLKDEDGLFHLFLKDKYRLQVEEGVLSLIEGILQRGIDRGVFRPMDTHAVAYFLFKLFQNFTFAKTDSLEGDEHDLEELLNFIIAGISKNP